MVEFALVVPLFVLLLVGLFDVGRAVYAYNTVNNAAREAGRLAIVDQFQNLIQVVENFTAALPDLVPDEVRERLMGTRLQAQLHAGLLPEVEAEDAIAARLHLLAARARRHGRRWATAPCRRRTAGDRG